MVENNWQAATSVMMLMSTLAREYVQAAGVERAEQRIAECLKVAEQQTLPVAFREANQRHAEALAAAVAVVKTQITLTGGNNGTAG